LLKLLWEDIYKVEAVLWPNGEAPKAVADVQLAE
jgi:hypothetical protein